MTPDPHVPGEKGALYKSRPQYVEAIWWTGENLEAVVAFATPEGQPAKAQRATGTTNYLQLLAGKDGAQGWVHVPMGHWLVHPPEDLTDIWPVEGDYFAAKYEAAAFGSQPSAESLRKALEEGE